MLNAACAPIPLRPAAPIAGAEWSRVGFSGVAPFASAVLVVHDSKFDTALPRIGVLELPAVGPVRYRSIAVGDWRGAVPDDLEAVCALPDRNAEFLLLESGHRPSRPGRVLHVRVSGNDVAGWSATVLGAARLPRAPEASVIADASNYEGIACRSAGADRVLVLLGERGGSTTYPHGVLRWAVLDLRALSFATDTAGLAGVAIESLPEWANVDGVRSIADLALTTRGELWAVATRDPGDAGPFESRVYLAARIGGSATTPTIEPVAAPRGTWQLDGIKIEGLARRPDGSWFFVSDDESFGGAFGVLPSANDRTAP